jgi:hypothetical protein
MSLVIGLCCREGAIVLTDSMAWRLREDGLTDWADVDPYKAAKIGTHDRLHFVHAGSGGPGDIPHGGSFVERARALYADLSRSRVAVPAGWRGTRPDGAEATAHDLAAFNEHCLAVIPGAWPPGPGDPALGLLTADGERWWAARDGGVAIEGTCGPWAREREYDQQPAPPGLAACELKAARLGQAFIQWRAARDAENAVSLSPGMGWLPPACGPLHALVVSAEGTRKWQVWI